MKDMNSHNRLVKHKTSESTSDSSESENDTLPVIKGPNNSDDESSHSSELLQKNKKRKHHHHHHHHHKRKYKRRDGDKVRYEDEKEVQHVDGYTSRYSHSTHRRYGESRYRENVDDASRHRQHRDDSGDRIRLHRKREGESRPRREDDAKYLKKSSGRSEKRDQEANARERRRDALSTDRKHKRHNDDNVSENRPIKQERSSEDGDYQWGRQPNSTGENKDIPPAEKAKPNFGLSGKLAEETNTFNGVVLKYSEPPEARKPKRQWRFYPFKGDESLRTIYLHRQSCYLIGRDRKVVDFPVDHPSCSKQHAALQYRLVPYQREDGSNGRRVRPYLIDLESANGTYVNNNKIEAKKYVELLEKDVVKFGYSSREYVLLHEQSKDDTMDDDVAGNE